MKRFPIMIITALLAWSMSATAQKSTLSGSISGLPEGTYAILDEVVGNQLRPVDTLKLDKSGSYKVAMNITEPTMYVLHTDSRDVSSGYFLLAPKEKVTADMVYLEEQKMFKITACKGSKNVDLYRQFNDLLLGAVNQTMQAMLPYQLEKLLRDNKDVLMSAFLVTVFEQDFENHAPLYVEIRDALQKEYPNHFLVKQLQDRLRNVLLPGMDAPDIAMKDPEGNVRKLSDLKGNVVLLDFWASWCSPCRRENPNVVKLYHRFHDKGFEIFSVSLDNTREAWVKAIKADGLVWPNHVSDLQGWTSTGGKTYGVSSVPNTILIDRDGKIIARNLRGAELEKKLEEIFGK